MCAVSGGVCFGRGGSLRGRVVCRRVRDLTTSKIGVLLKITGQVVRTHPVHPELISGTFVCLDCQTVVKDVEQQFKYTQVRGQPGGWGGGQRSTGGGRSDVNWGVRQRSTGGLVRGKLGGRYLGHLGRVGGGGVRGLLGVVVRGQPGGRGSEVN